MQHIIFKEARTASGTTTVYVQSGQQTIADYTAGANSSSPLYRYVYGSYIDEPVLRYQPTGAQSVYYHRNQQYSVTALTNSSGAILERYAYTAYGVPTITNATGTILTFSAHNNRYTYTGREWDQTISLYHYRARMYDPELGRFCGRDPIGYVDSYGLQAYCVSNPLRATDPTGLRCKPRVKQPLDWSDWQGGSMLFWRRLYGWAWHYEYEYTFVLKKRFTDDTFSIAAASAGKIMHWGLPYGTHGGKQIGNGKAISAVQCEISCTDDCHAVVDSCSISGVPTNRTHNLDKHWFAIANYTYHYNGPVVTFGYFLDAGFSFNAAVFDPGIEYNSGPITVTGGFSTQGSSYERRLSDGGDVSYVCECDEEE